MNRILVYMLGISVWSFLGVSCDKEEIMTYDPNRPGIEFDGSSLAYSFKKTLRSIDTVEIPFTIVGYPEQKVRQAAFEIVADSTTATAGHYRILDAIVPPGEYKGMVRVRVENTEGENFRDVRVYLSIMANEDFIPAMDDKKDCILLLTNSLIRPKSWTTWVERYFLGSYSTAYYSFVIFATGETEFPYPSAIPGYNDGKKWSSGDKNAFLDKLKSELRKRNESAGTPLVHDDGPAKGKEIIVGQYYGN